jgi:hypothetical protein
MTRLDDLGTQLPAADASNTVNQSRCLPRYSGIKQVLWQKDFQKTSFNKHETPEIEVVVAWVSSGDGTNET